MYGAIIGDLAGSIYEYNQTKEIKNIVKNEIIEENSFYSDDTILTIAIIDAIMNNKDYESYLKNYIKKYASYKPNYTPYFKSSFSPNMIKWANGDISLQSKGNGALMRISPVGFLFNREKEVIENAISATIPSHNTDEAISSAIKLSLIIFYLRMGIPKEDIYKKLKIELKYNPFTKFNMTCSETLDNCLYTFFYSNSFNDAIKKIIYMGGDTDTNAAIVGSLAEAAYKIDEQLIEKANQKIPPEFVKVLTKYYKN